MIKVLELFAGYGGASWALKLASIPHEIIGFCEIDKHAQNMYLQNHGETNLYSDITKIVPEELPDFDLLTGGFPCQSFSIAGKRKGFEDTRGTLFFDICRIAQVKKPKYLLLENVKGLTNHDNGKTFTTIIHALKNLGYGVVYKVLNSKDYGVPQNRERIWLVCKLGGWDFMEFQFPEKEKLNITVKDVLEDEVDKKYYLSEKQIKILQENERHSSEMLIKRDVSSTLCARDYKDRGKRIQIADFRNDEGLRIRKDEISPCMSARRHSETDITTMPPIVHSLHPRNPDKPSLKYSSGGSGYLSRDDGITYCLDTGNSQAIEREAQWRRLTPRECYRLMGFLNDEINLSNISDTQLYKMAGNGWDVNLVSKIMKRLIK